MKFICVTSLLNSPTIGESKITLLLAPIEF